MVNQHLEDSLAKVRAIFEKTAARIDALKPGEKIPATQLAEELAKEIGMTGPALYPTLKFLLNDKYPGVEIRKGAHGGVFKLDPNKPAKVVPATVVVAAPANVPASSSDDVVESASQSDSAEDIAAEKELQPIVNT